MQTPQVHGFFKLGMSKQQPLFDFNCEFLPQPIQEWNPKFNHAPQHQMPQFMRDKQHDLQQLSQQNYHRNNYSQPFDHQHKFEKSNHRIARKRQQMHAKIRENYIQAFKQKERKILIQKNNFLNQLQTLHEKLRRNKLQFKKVNQAITFIFNNIQQYHQVIANLHILEGLVIIISKNLNFKNVQNVRLIQDFCYLMNKCIEWNMRRNWFFQLIENSLQIVYLIFAYLMNEQQYFPSICNLLTNLSASNLMDAQKYRKFWQNGEILERIINSPKKCQIAFVELLYSFYSGNNKATMKPLKDRFVQLTRIFQVTLADQPYLTSFLISRLQFIPDSLLQLLEDLLKQSLQKKASYKFLNHQISNFSITNQMDQQNMQAMQVQQSQQYSSPVFDQTIMLICEVLYRQLKINESDLQRIFVGWRIQQLLDRFEQDQ